MKLAPIATATLALVFATACATHSEPAAGPPSPQDMDPALMEARWMEYSTPDAHHERLQSLAGVWRGTATTYHEQPETTEIVVSRHPVLGGRFLLEQFRGSFAGMPFEGLSLAGYDKFKDEWVSVWADNFGTGLYVFTGESDGNLDTLTIQSAMEVNPITRTESAMKGVTTRTGNDSEQFVMYDVYPDGTERKTMEIELRKTNE